MNWTSDKKTWTEDGSSRATVGWENGSLTGLPAVSPSEKNHAAEGEFGSGQMANGHQPERMSEPSVA